MSELLKISFPDGAVKEFAKGTTTEDILCIHQPWFKKKSIAGKFNGELYDLKRPIEEDGTIEIVTQDQQMRLKCFATVQLI